MSSAPSWEPEESLSGAFVDVAIVENVGETDETETFLTRTTQDVTVSKNANTTEFEPNSSRHRESFETHSDRQIEVPLLQNADTDLEVAGVFDDGESGDGEELFNTVHDAIRLYVFRNREDDTASQEREARRVRASLGEESYPADAATATITFTVMGEYRKAVTESA